MSIICHFCTSQFEMSFVYAGENRTREDFLKVNPHKKVPAIDDSGFCLSER